MPNFLGVATIVTVAVVVYVAAHVYIHKRLVRLLGLGSRARRRLACAWAVLAALYPMGRIVYHVLGGGVGALLVVPGSVYLGIFTMAVSLFLLVDVVWWIPIYFLRRAGKASIRPNQRLARLEVVLIAVTTLCLCGYGAAEALRGPSVTTISLSLARLPRTLDGMRIVQLSDLHFGGLVGAEYVRRVCRLVRSLKPDLLVLTGDLTDRDDQERDALLREVFQIPARLGVYGVLGNHEAYVDGPKAGQRYEALGLGVLRNEHVVVADGLVLAGVDDPVYLGGRAAAEKTVARVLRAVPKDRPVILLSHEPVGVGVASKAGADLMLAGHTHGGQIPPFHLISKLAYGYLAGAYEVGKMLLYVNKGAGFWGPPMRILARPEVLLLILRAG